VKQHFLLNLPAFLFNSPLMAEIFPELWRKEQGNFLTVCCWESGRELSAGGSVLTHSSVTQNQGGRWPLPGVPKSAGEFSASCLTAQQKWKREWKELFRLTSALTRQLLS